MKNLTILRGLPGSGKSYLTKLSYSDKIVCSADDYFYVGKTYVYDTTRSQAAHAYCQWKAKQACKLGTQLIFIDNTNINWNSIQYYVKIGHKYNYNINILEPLTWWRYNVKECVRRNRHDVPEDVIQSMWDQWESTEDIKEKINGTNLDNV